PPGPLLVPAAVWNVRRAELIRRSHEHGEELGVWLNPEEGPETLEGSLDDLSVIAIHFAKRGEGRGFSTGHLLRTRHGFQGELRAFGEIGRDQLFYLARVGFDAFQLRDDENSEEALAGFDIFPDAYQGAADETLPLFRRRFA
ncbi:MAG: DUF934 domain-containing protein, partial [Rhodocyclaceae bacterium]|nr:DUF934 domain-containing protein [Rhodocyclaceae bacterium]